MSNSPGLNTGRDDPRFVELLRPVQKQLYHFARALTDDYDDACDLVSDTILGGLESYDARYPVETFRSFLFTIAVRIHQRKKRRSRLFRPIEDIDIETARSHFTQPDETADILALYLALNKLPEKQREALALFELTGMSLKEIQKIQGVSLSAVKSRIVRGRKKLARILGVPFESEQNISARKDQTEHASTTSSINPVSAGEYK